MTNIKSHPLINTLIHLKGNPRACIYTEPLWALPYQLYIPFVSLYMYSLGLNDVQIGALLSISLFTQLLSALLGGVLTDKWGRRFTTFIVDIFAWSIPCLIWAFAQDFRWFVAAAVLNSVNQITATSWNCLLVEDAEKNKLADIFALAHICGLLAVFFAPISGILVKSFTLVPVMRIIYIITFISMTAKFITLYIYSSETDHGIIRRAETKSVPFLSMFQGYGLIFKKVLRSPEMSSALIIMVGTNVVTNIINNFYPLLASNNLGLPQQYLAYFPILRSAIMLVLLFAAQGIMNRLPFKVPMLVGLVIFIMSQLLLIFGSVGGFSFIVGYVVLEALGFGILIPRRDALVARQITPDERARIYAVMNAVMLGGTMPFGYFAGLLSDIDRRLPFVLNSLILLGLAVMIISQKVFDEQSK